MTPGILHHDCLNFSLKRTKEQNSLLATFGVKILSSTQFVNRIRRILTNPYSSIKFGTLKRIASLAAVQPPQGNPRALTQAPPIILSNCYAVKLAVPPMTCWQGDVPQLLSTLVTITGET